VEVCRDDSLAPFKLK